MARVLALQMTSGTEPDANLAWLEQQLEQCHFDEPTLAVLPECFACFGGKDKAQLAIAEPLGNGPIQRRLSQLARRYRVWLAAGSVPTLGTGPEKFQASCLVYDDQGRRIADYQKIHLFDVDVADKTRRYQESLSTEAGQQVVTFDSPFGRVGVAICYDIRFPGLFQAMGNIDVLVLPAAFTEVTGQAHWHCLLRARAVELQAYVVAANQVGEHANGRRTYGHSLIVSPWGEVLAELPHGTGFIGSQLDPATIKQIRQDMPVHQHNQFRSYLVKPD